MASRWLHVTRLPHSSRAATRLQTRSLLLWTQAQSGGLAVPQLLSSHSILSLTGPLSHQATWTSFSPPPPVLQRPYTAQSLPHVLSAAPQQQAELARGLLESFRQSGSRSSHSEHRRALRSLRYLLYTLLAGIGGYELLFGNAIDVPSFLNPEGGWRGGDGDNEWEPKGPRSSKEGWIPGVWTRGLFSNVPLIIELLLVSNAVIFGLGRIPALNLWMREMLACSPYNVLTMKRFWTLFTSSFVHLGPTHFMFNSAALYFVGSPLLMRIGDSEFTKFFCGTAVGSAALGSVIQMVISPLAFRRQLFFTPGVGMSGVLMAMFSMQAWAFPHDRWQLIFLPGIDLTARQVLGLVVGFDVLGLASQWWGRFPYIHHGVHLAGTSLGILWYFYLRSQNRLP